MMRQGIRHLWSHVRRLWRPALTLSLLVAGTTQCIEWKQPTASTATSVAAYVAAVQTATGDANAILRNGTPPTPGSGPVVFAPVPVLALLGGTIQVTASSGTAFTKVIVTVAGVSDYWELTLPAATTSVQLLVVFGQEIPKSVFGLRLGGANGSAFGPVQQSSVSVISVGTGDVQINVTWDSKADLDLHVVDPSGAEIWYGGRTSATGGMLDLDSNAACQSDGPRAENVFWAGGLIAPHGDYIVRVDNWAACTAVKTNYVVTVNVRGRPPMVFSGFFNAAGDGGSRGAGRNIVTVTY